MNVSIITGTFVEMIYAPLGAEMFIDQERE